MIFAFSAEQNELRSVVRAFLERRSPDVWAYYSITRILPAGFLARGHEKSYINRAVALFRHYMRLPTDAEPPAAP